MAKFRTLKECHKDPNYYPKGLSIVQKIRLYLNEIKLEKLLKKKNGQSNTRATKI
jgi:hypothetical protein